MKLTVVSHSLVAERQARFFNYFAEKSGFEVQQIYPLTWGEREYREGGFKVHFEGDMRNFLFPTEAYRAIEKFRPDIVYVQNEFWCRVTELMYRVARSVGAKFIVFIWENLPGKYLGYEEIIRDTDLIICGNSEAEELVKPFNEKTLRMIQVGLDTELFKPDGQPKDTDLLFLGRHVKEKGIHLIEQAVETLNVKIHWKSKESFTPYHLTPGVYNRAKVHLAPSIDVAWWKEQHSGYANLEALSCGLRVVTSTSKAIVEYLEDCPGKIFVPQNDYVSLREAILTALQDWRLNTEGREFVERNFSMPVMARGLGLALRNA